MSKIPVSELKPGDVLYDCHREKAGNTTCSVDGVWACYVRDVGVDHILCPDGTVRERHWALIAWNGNAPRGKTYDVTNYRRAPKEWNTQTLGDGPRCYFCGGKKADGHKPDCEHPAADRARKRVERAAAKAAKDAARAAKNA